ncbi:hypothetical protein [Rubripirellula amarantea]|uniref:hypothetical protein n=1 Tax=Rubripirellula amarantea TaxID=2527999 RepID=UPI0011B3A3FC|nr:hypothetical protein [Rubripirellula amarantea]
MTSRTTTVVDAQWPAVEVTGPSYASSDYVTDGYVTDGYVTNAIVTQSQLGSVQWEGSQYRDVPQWAESDREQLAVYFEEAADRLEDERLPSASAGRQAFLRDLAAAETFLKNNTSVQNYQRWMQYLDVEPLVSALEEPKALTSSRGSRLIGREAVDLRYRLIGVAPGLELTVLKQLRDSTESLIDAMRFRDGEASVRAISKQLESFADEVREMESNPSADDVAKLGQMMALLGSANQTPDLVSAVKSRFRSPNIGIIVSEQVVQSAINRGVNECRPVRDCILGTSIVGNATLGGVVTADVLPAVGSARVQVALNATVTSRNVGYNGPVKLHTVGTGQVAVTRMLHISELGVQAEPAISQASLQTQIVSIDAKLRLIRRIAKKKAAEQKPAAERIATEKLRQQVGSQFAQQTDEASSISPPDFMGKLRPYLDRLDLQEPTRLIGSTDQSIYVDATLARDDQLSAPAMFSSLATRPTIGQYYDVALQIHETAIDNVISPVLAGRTMTESELNRLLGRQPEPSSANVIVSDTEQEDEAENEGNENDEEDDDEPFEIDFARLRPVIFEARNQRVKLGIRGTRFSSGDRELKQAMEITTTYIPVQLSDGTSMLLRDGEVDVDFPGRRKTLSVSQTGVKTTIQKKFADVFPETLLHRDLQVPPTVKLQAIAGRSFRPKSIDARDGWFTVTVVQ